jgi:hypothetical protein
MSGSHDRFERVVFEDVEIAANSREINCIGGFRRLALVLGKCLGRDFQHGGEIFLHAFRSAAEPRRWAPPVDLKLCASAGYDNRDGGIRTRDLLNPIQESDAREQQSATAYTAFRDLSTREQQPAAVGGVTVADTVLL